MSVSAFFHEPYSNLSLYLYIFRFLQFFAKMNFFCNSNKYMLCVCICNTDYKHSKTSNLCFLLFFDKMKKKKTFAQNWVFQVSEFCHFKCSFSSCLLKTSWHKTEIYLPPTNNEKESTITIIT